MLISSFSLSDIKRLQDLEICLYDEYSEIKFITATNVEKIYEYKSLQHKRCVWRASYYIFIRMTYISDEDIYHPYLLSMKLFGLIHSFFVVVFFFAQ